MRNLALVVSAIALSLCACQPSNKHKGADGLPPSFTLQCAGPEQIEMELEGVKQPFQNAAPTSVIYRWNGKTKTLVTEHRDVDASDFCYDAGQEKCDVAVAGDRLTAQSFDLRSGNTPDAVNSFSETIDIDLRTLFGTATMTTTVGTLTDETAKVHQKTTARMTLTCKRSA